MEETHSYDHAVMAQKDTLRAMETANSISDEHFAFVYAAKKDLKNILNFLRCKQYSEALEAAIKLDDFIPPPEKDEDKNMSSFRSDVIEIVWEIEDCLNLPVQDSHVAEEAVSQM